ncbi:PQQ-dependent sugar dehydrogenase, partial [Tamlana flava]|uniref:PQQ-dependent sugar dehydrogenase n=1 Tax=Tamlana flava TaxID=3158572 RepID=UPI00351B3763
MHTLLRSRINSKIVLISTLLFSSVFFAQGTLLVTANGNPVNSGPLPTATSTTNFTDFGNVEIGSSLQHIFVLDNTGANGSPNQLNGITAGLSGSSNFSLSSTSLGNLAGNGGTVNLTITYSPTSNTYETADVTISFSNGTNAPYTFTIDGSGIMPTPEIEIEDSSNNIIAHNTSFDFGTITPNSISSETFSIKNTSVNATTLTLEGINPNYVTISGDSEFSIISQPSSNTIPGGSAESFTIAYSPTAVGGPHSATISIDNDDPDDGEDPYTFTVTGLSDNIIYTPTTSGPDWNVTNITPDNELNYPNTIVYGPDNYLWITERVGKQVVKVDPVNGGSKSVMLDLTSVVYQTAGQDGLMGMAVHPDLYNDINTSNNLVYLAYTYDSGGRKLRIESYRYISSTGTLDASSATTILEGFDASNDHNSGKLQIGPDMKLYYTAGDQGYNQFQNACLEIRAQYLPTSPSDYSDYKGKILRMNLDGSIPSDNPILNSVQSHVYTYGHRNPQGIVFGSNGALYSSEHGPKVDDEINIITAGKNYGWPQIAGYYDNLGYGYCNWS